MTKKHCAFQYATACGEIIEDTGLLTITEAVALKHKYLVDFKKRLHAGEEPEMVIWINMENETDYRETSFHICAEDTVVENGVLYHVTKEPIG